MSQKIPISECIMGRVYKIGSRNLSYGVYDGNEGFIGIRKKFGRRYLFTEYHWDQGPPFGTVHSQADTGIDIPEDIEVAITLGDVDEKTLRPVYYHEQTWFFKDSNEASQDIEPVDVPNDALFAFLEKIQQGEER